MMRQTIEYLCPFVPPELILAWGFEPRRVKLRARSNGIAEHNITAGVCPIAESLLDEFSQSAATGVIFSTTCDQMRRVREIHDSRRGSAESFLLNVPASWQDDTCFEYYLSELGRLGGFLESIGGRRTDDKKLATIAREHAELRVLKIQQKNKSTSGIRLALVGSALREEDDWIFEYVCQSGGQIVLNATNNGDMLLPGAALSECLDDDPLRDIARVYFDQPHLHQRPDSKFFECLMEQIRLHDVQGVILVRMPWCDTVHGVARRLKAAIDLPVLELADAEQSARTHMENRISAFMEMFS